MSISELTLLLEGVRQGDRDATSKLFATVYDQLRRMAAAQMSTEGPQTLQSTALVHEVWVKLVGKRDSPTWADRKHFFAAAAQAMRRILVDSARTRRRLKRGGDAVHFELREDDALVQADEDLIALDEALECLREQDEKKAELVCLKYFGGLTNQQAADQLGVSLATAERHWAFAKAWLRAKIENN